MAWLPAFKYIKGLFALEGLFLKGNGQNYVGPYHELYNGETYTGSFPSADSERIYRDEDEPALDPKVEDKFFTEQTFPEPEDYDRGFFTRYFLKDLRNGKLVETTKNTYGKKTEESYILGTTLKWILTKPVKDIFNQGFLYKGAITRNKENTLKASLIMKGLTDFIVKYDKFVNVKSDVEGFKFEELPPAEKRRIIIQQSSLRTPPKLIYPHLMYNPKTGEEVLTKTVEEHNYYMDLGWVHEKPRFTKRPKIKRPRKKLRPIQRRSSTGSGGGGGGYGGRDYTISEETGDTSTPDQFGGGGGGNSPSSPSQSPSQGNYY